MTGNFVLVLLPYVKSRTMPKPKMLTCIARPKQQHGNNVDSVSQRGDLDFDKTPKSKQLAIKTLTSQIKVMAVKASGAYKCNPCSHPTPNQPKKNAAEPAAVDGGGSERFRWSGSYRRTTSSSSASRWGKEMEARLKVLSTVSSREGSVRSPYGSGAVSAAASGRRTEPPLVLVEETEPKEWVAQVEPGVLITFVSLPRGGNDLKRIRFSRDTFDNTQAQKWWTDNHEKVMELYNVQRLNRQGVPFPTDPPKPEEKISKKEFTEEIPRTPPLTPEILPWNLHPEAGTDDYSSSDSYDNQQQQQPTESHQINESSGGIASTPKYSNISNANKLETSSMDDQSMMSTSSIDVDHQSGKLSFSNASELETEWVEEDEPGVYITIRALPGGRRELRRVRFSRERFAEMNARLWWEENRARIHEQYL
ncbi:hypothetical protein V2J09_000215 [Rumex salicifolius]